MKRPPSEPLLLLDASTRMLQVGVWGAGRLLGEISVEPRATASQVLVPHARQLLGLLGLELSDLAGVVTPNGPGYFTGLRIALVTAATLSANLERPLLTVDTLAVVALNHEPWAGRLAVLLDAKKRQVFWAEYEYDGSEPRRVCALRSSTPEELAAAVQASGCRLLTGEGLALHGAALRALLPAEYHLATPGYWLPRCAGLGYLGALRLRQGHFTDPLHLDPEYGRASDAELGNPVTPPPTTPPTTPAEGTRHVTS